MQSCLIVSIYKISVVSVCMLNLVNYNYGYLFGTLKPSSPIKLISSLLISFKIGAPEDKDPIV